MLQHAALETRSADVEAMLAFWELVGFAPVPPPEALRGRSAWVQRGATQIHLLITEDAVAPPSGHVAVVVEDYDAGMERLRAAGFEPEDRPRHWGAARSFVRAPGGHRVELMSAPPADAA
jgi:catechol 2,3-dioxygenase-like lactoylglutathione lyase family enzyme